MIEEEGEGRELRRRRK